jgi:hypothetical protein
MLIKHLLVSEHGRQELLPHTNHYVRSEAFAGNKCANIFSGGKLCQCRTKTNDSEISSVSIITVNVNIDADDQPRFQHTASISDNKYYTDIYHVVVIIFV